MPSSITVNTKTNPKARLREESGLEKAKKDKARALEITVEPSINTIKKRKHSGVQGRTSAGDEENPSVFDFPDSSSLEQRPAKRRRSDIDEKQEACRKGNELETSKPSAIFRPKKPRNWTVSLAIPGSIIAKSVIAYL
jgi:hypothetical protein